VSRALGDAINRLTRDHKTSLDTDDGTRYVTVTALLTQLREAYLDTNGSGGAGDTHGKLPINVPATDLLTLIDTEATELLAGCSLRPRKGSTEAKVRSYGAAILAFGAGEVAHAETIVTGWVASIEGLLYPAAKRRPFGQPCPACGSLWVLGENGRTLAVTIQAHPDKPTSTWDAHCAACSVVWVGDQISYLLKAVAS
jgi:hypothetical protein